MYFNNILEKDEAIKAASSSSEVEEALAGLSKSLEESRKKYEDDKAIWENKIKCVETTQ